MKKAALFSLNDTSKAELFASVLIKAGWEIVASRETVSVLSGAGLPVTDMADFTGVKKDYGFPPTLHPRVEAALTASEEPRIELVYVLPYPLEKGNDIGGRTLLALAAKGGRIPVMSIADMEKVVAQVSAHGDIDPAFRQELIGKTYFEISRHYARLASATGGYDVLPGRFAYGLLNGENPYQVPAEVFCCPNEDYDALSFCNFDRVSGEAPCFTNAADADCIVQTLCLVAESCRRNTAGVPYICVAAKHGNPCGLGLSRTSAAEAVERALFGNPRSIWGGEVVVNFPVDAALAGILFKSDKRAAKLADASWMLDIILSPGFSPEAVALLGKRQGRKLFSNAALAAPFLKKSKHDYRFVRGGFLRQVPANYVLDIGAVSLDGGAFLPDALDDLIISWATAFSSNHGGNEVSIAKNGALIGVGGGPSTFEAARVAVERATECGHDSRGSVFAADAFFPFTDAPAVLCGAGVSAGCVPLGGKRENDVREFLRNNGVKMAYMPPDCRGFCRH